MDTLFGNGNDLTRYLSAGAVYLMLFVLMRYANRSVELNFRRTRLVLGIGWALGTFFGNYLFYLWGFMSFLPWLNNFVHTFVWIGLCLSFLYAGAYTRPFWEQFLLFAIFSFIVKVAENHLLGTWEMDRFLFWRGKYAYIIGWSLMDGLYPVISVLCLRVFARFVPGLVVPDLR